MKWPLFPVSVVGSWPRPASLLAATKRQEPDLAARQDRAVEEALEAQERAGVDIVTDGEQRRDNFYSFLCERVEGMKLMTMAELLDHVEDKAAFEKLLEALDVPAFAIKNPTVVGKLKARGSLVRDDVRFLRQRTDKPIKATLPGPYLLCRSAWVENLSGPHYPSRLDLADDVVSLLRSELQQLAALGCEVVQFDEPVLTELAFAGKSATRTFMCAALAASASPEQELDLAVDLINRVIDGIEGPLLAMHVCRGNWSQDDDVLLAGSYEPLLPWFQRMKLDQFVLEYATPRAGPPELLAQLPETASVGFGVVNPRTTEIEDPAQVVERVRPIAKLLGPERIFLNPDCGFGTFADRPVNETDIAEAKLATLHAAAERLREELG